MFPSFLSSLYAVLYDHAPDLVHPTLFLWREHSIREAWEQPTGGLVTPDTFIAGIIFVLAMRLLLF